MTKNRDDRRPQIREFAMRSKALTWREKCVLARLTEIPAEIDPDSGTRRLGSQAMDANGFVALRREYVATMLGCGLEAVKEAEDGLRAKGFLSLVHSSSFGRPTKYQALINRGETPPLRRGKTHGVTPRKTPHQGETDDPTADRGETPPPTLRRQTSPTTRPGLARNLCHGPR